MPTEIYRRRFKVTGHRIESADRVVHFFTREADANAPAGPGGIMPGGMSGDTEVITTEANIIPDGTIVEMVQTWETVL